MSQRKPPEFTLFHVSLWEGLNRMEMMLEAADVDTVVSLVVSFKAATPAIRPRDLGFRIQTVK